MNLSKPAKHLLMCSLIVKSVLLSCLLGFAGSAHSFELSNSFWQEGSVEFNVNFPDRHADNNPLPSGSSSLSDLQEEFLRSMEEWTTESTFDFIANTDTPAVDPCGASGNGTEFADTFCGSAFGSATLAVQIASFSGSSRSRSTIIFNSQRRWEIFAGFRPNSVDFRRIALHELGHAVGLNHEDDGTATIMTTSVGNLRTLQTDDIEGAAARYDLDNDGIGFAQDNCTEVSNASQSDLDADDIGDACDSDIDNDGVFNSSTIDQEFANQAGDLSSGFFSASGNQLLAQTFTVGINGRLEALMLPIFCGADATTDIEIQSVSNNGGPSGQILDTIRFSNGLPTSNGDFLTIDLNSSSEDDLSIESGQVLAIVLRSNTGCGWFRANSSQNYNGGAGFFGNGANFFPLNQGGDLPFAVQVAPAQIDNCPVTQNPDQADADGNQIGDACEIDGDNDLDQVLNGVDNCPLIANTDQLDFDQDDIGDVCDPDDDNDQIEDDLDNCPFSPNPLQEDFDGDESGDACDNDIDNDNVLNGGDSQPLNPLACSDNDTDQCDDCSSGLFNLGADGLDTDNDGLCDLGDPDDDNDQIPDEEDNCSLVANDQTDNNGNGIGDACDDEINNEFCFPIRASNNNFAVVCL